MPPCAICLQRLHRSEAEPPGSGSGSGAGPGTGRGRTLATPAATLACLHTFDFDCILEWATINPSCPLCKAPIASLFRKARGSQTLEEVRLPVRSRRDPETRPGSSSTRPGAAQRFGGRGSHGPRPRAAYPSSRPFPGPPPSQEEFEADTRAQRALDRRRLIYRQGWYARHFGASPASRFKLEVGPFLMSDPGTLARLTPWIRRDLQALLPVQPELIKELVLAVLRQYHPKAGRTREILAEYLGPHTPQFVHELTSFWRCPWDMETWDRLGQWDAQPPHPPRPNRDSSAPSAQPVDHAAGPSRLRVSTRRSREPPDRGSRPVARSPEADEATTPAALSLPTEALLSAQTTFFSVSSFSCPLPRPPPSPVAMPDPTQAGLIVPIPPLLEPDSQAKRIPTHTMTAASPASPILNLHDLKSKLIQERALLALRHDIQTSIQQERDNALIPDPHDSETVPKSSVDMRALLAKLDKERASLEIRQDVEARIQRARQEVDPHALQSQPKTDAGDPGSTLNGQGPRRTTDEPTSRTLDMSVDRASLLAKIVQERARLAMATRGTDSATASHDVA